MPAFSGPENHLRAKGNLDYLQFIRLVRRYWSEAHPDIPIIPVGDQKPAKYPCILYGLEVRQTAAGETKAKHRERIDDTVITAQKFDNMVSFSAVAEHKPELCEEIIEEFENWMLEMVPVFKELGIAELTYGRRLPDSEVSRRGFGIVARAVVFHVRTEKVRATSYKKLLSIVVDARTRLEESNEHPAGSQFTSITPRFYGKIPTYTIEHFEDWDEAEEGKPAPSPALSIPQTNFLPGDIIYIAPQAGDFPPSFYMVMNATEESGPPYADKRYYEISRVPESDDAPEIIEITGHGAGRVFYLPDRDVEVNITDEFKTTPRDTNN